MGADSTDCRELLFACTTGRSNEAATGCSKGKTEVVEGAAAYGKVKLVGCLTFRGICGTRHGLFRKGREGERGSGPERKICPEGAMKESGRCCGKAAVLGRICGVRTAPLLNGNVSTCDAAAVDIIALG
jgi:hypothetical protein